MIMGIDLEKKSNIEVLQHIEITKDLEYRDFIGRFTKLVKGAMGFIVTDDNAGKLFEGLSDARAALYINILNDAIKTNRYAGVVAGYLCLLDSDDFIKIAPPKMTPIPGIF